MKKTAQSILLICLFISSQIFGQEKIDLLVIDQIKKEGFDNSKVLDFAFNLTDANGPRVSGTPGLRKALEWAKKEFTKMGLSNATIEPWGTFGRGWENKHIYVAMTEPSYSPLIAYPKVWTPSTNGTVTGQPIIISIKSDSDFAAYQGKLKNKIILLFDEKDTKPHLVADAKRHTDDELLAMMSPQEETRSRPASGNFAAMRELRNKISKFLVNEGVAVQLEPSSKGDDGTVFVQNGGSRNIGGETGVPCLVLAAEHYNRIFRLVKNNIPLNLEINIQNTFFESDSLEYNVIAEIPGTDKNLKSEIVMLGAHIDSWQASTGATDNASGSSVVMEAVRILKSIGAKPKRTIRVCLWTGEESGLLGSSGYVSKHVYDSKNNIKLADYEKISAYFNLDNGTGKIRGVYLQGNEMVRPIFEKFLTPFNDLDAKTLTIRNTGGTDHLSFDKYGIPGFQFIQDPIDYSTRTHHSNMDDYDHLVKEDLQQASVIMAGFVYMTAQRDEKLPRKNFEEPKKN